MDITSGVSPASGSAHAVKPSTAVKIALDEQVPLSAITMSSDGNGSMPIFDDAGNTIGVGVADQKSLFTEFRDMVQQEKIALSDAIQVLSTNVAQALKLYPQKGCIAAGSDADFLLIDQEFTLTDVWAKGQHMVENSQAIVKGTFE